MCGRHETKCCRLSDLLEYVSKVEDRSLIDREVPDILMTDDGRIRILRSVW